MSKQKNVPYPKNGNEISAFLCIITPVFDQAYESVYKLINELNAQTYGNFFQVMISNGPSPRIKELVFDINRQDPRFIYDEIEEEITNNPIETLVNLGKRREYCLKKYNAERYVFLDADVKLVDNDYFLKLYKAHQEIKRDVLMPLVKIFQHGSEITLPIFPIIPGHIDVANYTFSKKLAKHCSYPTDYDPNMGISNDYRFFSRISNENNTALLNFVSAIRDGNNSYKRLTESWDEQLRIEREKRELEERLRIESEKQELEERLRRIEREKQELEERQRIEREQKLLINRILRPGTRRRYYCDLVQIGIRVIMKEGWKSFFIKLWNWLRYKG